MRGIPSGVDQCFGLGLTEGVQCAACGKVGRRANVQGFAAKAVVPAFFQTVVWALFACTETMCKFRVHWKSHAWALALCPLLLTVSGSGPPLWAGKFPALPMRPAPALRRSHDRRTTPSTS